MDSISYFRKTLRIHQDGPQAVSWKSKESQELRFKILSQIGDLNAKSILDVGCGLGDFYGYLKPKGAYYSLQIDYTGYDNVPEMVEAARKKYPEAKFVNEFPKEQFDYVFESGIFNLEIPKWEETTFLMLRRMWDRTKIGMGINFLSSMSQKKDDISHYADPIKILEFVYTLTPKFVWRNDYLRHDFCIYCYK